MYVFSFLISYGISYSFEYEYSVSLQNEGVTRSDNNTSGWDEIIDEFNRMSTELHRRRERRSSPPIKKPNTCSLKIDEMNNFIKILEEYLQKSLDALPTQLGYSSTNNTDKCQKIWNEIKLQVNKVIRERIEMETAENLGKLSEAMNKNSALQEETKRLQSQLDNLKKTVNETQRKELGKLVDLLVNEADRVRKLEKQLKNEKNRRRNITKKFIDLLQRNRGIIREKVPNRPFRIDGCQTEKISKI